MKAKAGEVSQSARALAREDLHRLYDLCMNSNLSVAERRKGIIRYVSTAFVFPTSTLNTMYQTAYLFAFLMLLRIEEVVRLEFEGIDAIPGERKVLLIKLRNYDSDGLHCRDVYRSQAHGSQVFAD